MYEIELSKQALEDLREIEKSNSKAFKKFEALMPELREHPYTGTGHPHQLRYVEGIWSRKLDKKNRIRYTVNDDRVIVFVVSALGHYDDK